MQPRVYKEPPAPDDPATPESQTPRAAGSSGASPASPLPSAIPYPEAPPRPPVAESSKQLEDRLNKLEDVLKSLRAQQFTTAPTQPPPPAFPSPEMLLGAGQMLSLAHQALQPLSDPQRAAAIASTLRTDGPILFEMYAELRCILRMYVDPRYSLSWMTRVTPWAILVLMVGAWIGFSGMTYVGPVLEHVTFAVLLYVLYKVLGREAHRYRQTSPDLPPSLRL